HLEDGPVCHRVDARWIDAEDGSAAVRATSWRDHSIRQTTAARRGPVQPPVTRLNQTTNREVPVERVERVDSVERVRRAEIDSKHAAIEGWTAERPLGHGSIEETVAALGRGTPHTQAVNSIE